MSQERNTQSRSKKRPPLASSPEKCGSDNITLRDIHGIISDTLATKMDEMLRNLKESINAMLVNELRVVKQELNDLKQSMCFISNQYEDILNDLKSTSETVKHLESKNNEMQLTIDSMKDRMNQLEQRARICNLEIQCVPENKNENLLKTVTLLASVIDCNISEENIIKCTRVAKLNPDSPRPRSVVVQFNSPRIRDTFLASSIKFNKSNSANRLNSTHIGASGHKQPIYIMEHLTPAGKALHAATRVRAKENGYKHVWIRNGKIFVRKSDNASLILIKHTSCLDKLV